MTKTNVATFSAGCFWCYEPIFKSLKGVLRVTSGYAGGTKENPSYLDVVEGSTGHAESFQIEYDPAHISYNDLLTVFWNVHDPTSLNKQGNDVGEQYRSVIFYHDEEQKQEAEQSKRELEQSSEYDKPIVTEIVPLTKFYVAEQYHQNFFENNLSNPYCSYVITPKIQKFKKKFKNLIQ